MAQAFEMDVEEAREISNLAGRSLGLPVSPVPVFFLQARLWVVAACALQPRTIATASTAAQRRDESGSDSLTDGASMFIDGRSGTLKDCISCCMDTSALE